MTLVILRGIFWEVSRSQTSTIPVSMKNAKNQDFTMFCLPDGNIFAKMRVEYTFSWLIFYAESEFRVRNKKNLT